MRPLALLALLSAGCSLSAIDPMPQESSAVEVCQDYVEDVLGKMRSCAVPEDYIQGERAIRMGQCSRVKHIDPTADSPDACLQRVLATDCADHNFAADCRAFLYW